MLMALLPLAGYAGDIIITPGNMTKTYGTTDAEATKKFAVTGLTGADSKTALTDHLNIVRVGGNGESVGDYDYRLEWDGTAISDLGYSGTYDDIIVQGNATLTITKATFSTSAFTVNVTGSYTYTGSAIEPTVTVSNGDIVLDASQYTTALKDNVNASTTAPTVTVTVTDGDNFILTTAANNKKEKTFTIGQKNLGDTGNNAITITLDQDASVPYTEAGYTIPVPTVTWQGKTLEVGAAKDYTYSWSATGTDGKFKESGIYTLTLTAGSVGNFTGTNNKTTFTIEGVDFDASAELTLTLPADGYTYDGTAKKPATVVKINNTVWDQSAADADAATGSKYTIDWKNNTNAGTATVTITAAATTPYLGKTLTATFPIAALDISAAASAVAIDDITAVTYNTQEQKPAITVKKSGADFAAKETTGDKLTNYTIAYSDNINAGTAKVTITGANNYTGSVEKEFTINKVNIGTSTAVTFEAYDDAEYTGASIKPATTGKVSYAYDTEKSVTLEEGAAKDYTVTYGTNTAYAASNAGSVIYTGVGNFEGTKTVNFNITKKALTITADDITINHGEAIPTYTVTYNGLVDADKNTDGSIKEGVVTGLSVKRYTQGTTTETTSTNAGKYTLHPTYTAANNYTVTVADGTLDIVAQTISIAVKAKTITYGDAEPTYGADGTYSYTCGTTTGTKFSECFFPLEVTGLDSSVDKDNFFNGTTFTFTRAASTNKNKGDYEVVVSGPAQIAGGYNVTSYTKGTLTIAPYAVKVKAVDLASVAYNDGNPTISTEVNTTNINLFHNNGTTDVDVTTNMPDVAGGTTKLTVATIVKELKWVKDKNADNEDYVTMGHPGKRVVTLKDAADIVGYTNYTFTTVDGTITFTGTATTADFDGASNQLAAIQDKDNLTLTTVTVKTGRTGAREIKKQGWNAYILPFKTSVAEISKMNEIGYAVVNVLDAENSSEGNIKFKLWMGDIEANQPFCMKTLNDLPGTTALTFSNKTIVAPAAAKVEVAIGETGAKFIGCYDEYEITSTAQNENYCFNGGWYTASNSYPVKPFEAYIDKGSSNAPELHITFEEIDGSATAITSIIAEGTSALKADGWYTLSGVKLQAAPTEKGVYVKDGKKVVIK